MRKLEHLICLVDLIPGVDQVCFKSIPDDNLVLENTGAVQTVNDFVNDNPSGAKLLSGKRIDFIPTISSGSTKSFHASLAESRSASFMIA